MSCCVPLCPSRKGKSTTVAFHEFPSDIILMEKWLSVIQRENFVVNDKSATSFVCSLHFKPEDYRSNIKMKRLKKGCIPTIFNSRSLNLSKVANVQAKKASHDEKREYSLKFLPKPVPLTTSVIKTERTDFEKALGFKKNTLEYETSTLEFETNTLGFYTPVSHLDARNIVLETQPPIQNKEELQYELNCQHSREQVLALDKSLKPTPLTTCVNKTKEMEFDRYPLELAANPLELEANPLEFEANKLEFITPASGNDVFETQPLILRKKELQYELKHQRLREQFLALKKSLKCLRTSKWEKDCKIQQQQKIVDELHKKLKYYERNKFHTTLEKIIRLEEYGHPKANFILQQIENFDKVRPLWNNKTIRECILLRSTSADGYSLIQDRNILTLPSKMTLLRYVEPSESDTEIFTKESQSTTDFVK